MLLRLLQVRLTLPVLARVTPWTGVAVTAALGLFVLGLGDGDPGAIVFRMRLSGAAVAAATAWLLDDPAAGTMASSPTPLLVRRCTRIVGVAVVAAAWLVVAVVIAAVLGHEVPAFRLGCEMASLTALAVLGSIAAQRWSSDGRGGSAGAFVVAWWFGMTFLPRLAVVPLPPQPLGPGAAVPLLIVAGSALGLALVLSRDPAGRIGSAR